jgi:hypothetical protein
MFKDIKFIAGYQQLAANGPPVTRRTRPSKLSRIDPQSALLVHEELAHSRVCERKACCPCQRSQNA